MEVLIQSDNTSGFESEELIPVIFNMDTRICAEKNVVLIRWIFTEAQIGKTWFDTHYSCLNKKFQAYVEDDNDILIEDDIVKAVSFNKSIYGTTAVLVDAADLFRKRYLKIISKSRLTHGRPMKCVGWKILCM